MYCLARTSRAASRSRPQHYGYLAHGVCQASTGTCTTKATDDGERLATTTFNIQLIQSIKPFPKWLEGEMRSNHAGETGTVAIYEGALKALDIRSTMSLSYGDTGKDQLMSYEDRLRVFSLEHRDSEQSHVELLEAVLDGDGVSVLLPAWRIAGFSLGFASTIFCPRGMYLTTEAVETFVEEHYMAQIRTLRYEAAKEGLCSGDQDNANAARKSLKARAELISMLVHCCEDEVHHKEEARDRAAEGPFPWFPWVDTSWQWFVRTGSAVAANCAKRI